MPAPHPNGHNTNGATNDGSPPAERPPTFPELLTEAKRLRTVLHESIACLSRLIAGLKQHRRQSKAVQAAMQSLRQLKLDD